MTPRDKAVEAIAALEAKADPDYADMTWEEIVEEDRAGFRANASARLALLGLVAIDRELVEGVVSPKPYDGLSKYCPNCGERMPEAGDMVDHTAAYCETRAKVRIADAVLEQLRGRP